MNNIQKAFKSKAQLSMRPAAPQHFADGGMVNKMMGVVGMRNPDERMRDSVADQNAKQAAYEANKAAPAPQPQPTVQAAKTGLRGYAAGSDIEGRMKAAGMAHGGSVRGPGTGTSDSIPAMLSKGEYVLPADTVQHLGKENLDAMKDATHTPVHDGAAQQKTLRTGMNHLSGGGISDYLPDLRVQGKIDEDNAVAAGKAGTATPEQTQANASLDALKKSVNYNNPFDTPIVGPAASIGIRGAEAAVSAAPGMMSRAGGAISDAASSAFNGVRGMFSRNAVPAAVDGAAAPAAAAAARPTLKTAADSVAYPVTTTAAPAAANAVAPAAADAAPAAAAAVAPAAADAAGPLQTAVVDGAKTGMRALSPYVAAAAQGDDNGASAIKPTPSGVRDPFNDTRDPVETRSGAFEPVQMTDQQKWLVKNGVPLSDQNGPKASMPAGGWRNEVVDGGSAKNLGNYDGKTNIYGSSSNMDGGKMNTFSGIGADDGGAGDAKQRQMVAQKIADMRQTSSLMNEVQGLRVADNDRGAMNFGSGGGGVATLGGGSFGQDLRSKTDAGRVGSLGGGMSGAQLQHEASMAQTAESQRASRATNAATLRSQDITERDNARTVAGGRYGHDLTAQTARANNEREWNKFNVEQGNKDREHGLREKEFTQKQDEADFAVREKSSKDLAEKLGSFFPGADGKPDVVKVGAAHQAIHDELGARMQDLDKVLKTDPNYAEAQKLKGEISRKGVGALDSEDLRTLMSQAAIKDRVISTKSVLPGGSAPADSRLSGYAMNTDPKLAADGKNIFGSDTVTLKNGSKARANSLRFTEPANSMWPDIGHIPTDQFNAGLRGRGN